MHRNKYVNKRSFDGDVLGWGGGGGGRAVVMDPSSPSLWCLDAKEGGDGWRRMAVTSRTLAELEGGLQDGCTDFTPK